MVLIVEGKSVTTRYELHSVLAVGVSERRPWAFRL